tara:strand:- start:885 stop:1130 length:246 start_codon:yes stop_codon:yes gene_type:complete
MFYAIETHFLGPTNFKGSRIKARWDKDSFTMPYDHALDASQNHQAAAEALLNNKITAGDCMSLQIVGGGVTRNGYVFILNG